MKKLQDTGNRRRIHRERPRRRRAVALAGLWCLLLVLTAGVALPQEKSWDVVQVPGVGTNFGFLINHWWADLNNAGQVVTSMNNGGSRSVVIRYHSDTGEVDVIDPTGRALSMGWLINERGQIFGYNFKEGSSLQQTDVFLDTPGEGTDSLQESGRRVIWANFMPWDLTDRGEVTGTVKHRSGRAYLYSKELGWTDLSPLHPLLYKNGSYAVARTINAQGAILFTVAHPGGISPSYLWYEDRLIDLGRDGTRVNSPTTVSDEGYVPGVARDSRVERAYLFSTQTGRRQSIHLPRFRHSATGLVSSEGVFAVVASETSSSRMSTIYTYDVRRGPRARSRILARPPDFETVLEDSMTFLSVSLIDMNDRLEMVGAVVARIKTSNGNVKPVEVAFYLSPEGEVFPLQAAFDEAGIDYRPIRGEAVNERGQILVEATTRDLSRSHLYVLTPRP